MRSHVLRWVLLAVGFACLVGWMAAITPAARAVSIDWVAVGDSGNAADTTGYGAVGTRYRIAETEVTNAQYGNVWEWNEAIITSSDRGMRGGAFFGGGGAPSLKMTYRGNFGATSHDTVAGFRVAMIPEPGTGLLLMTGILGLAASRYSPAGAISPERRRPR